MWGVLVGVGILTSPWLSAAVNGAFPESKKIVSVRLLVTGVRRWMLSVQNQRTSSQSIVFTWLQRYWPSWHINILGQWVGYMTENYGDLTFLESLGRDSIVLLGDFSTFGQQQRHQVMDDCVERSEWYKPVCCYVFELDVLGMGRPKQKSC